MKTMFGDGDGVEKMSGESCRRLTRDLLTKYEEESQYLSQ